MINKMKMNLGIVGVIIMAGILSMHVDNGFLKRNILDFGMPEALNAISVGFLYIILLVLLNLNHGAKEKIYLMILLFGLTTELASCIYTLTLNSGLEMGLIIAQIVIVSLTGWFAVKELKPHLK